MVLLASDFDKSRYLRAEDLKAEKKFRIKEVTVEEIVDDKGKKGKRGEVDFGGQQTSEMWMRNIQTTPAQLLQRKFASQAQGGKQ